MNKNQDNFIVYIEKDEDGVFVGSVPAIKSCHAQGKTQKEMLKNLESVIRLCFRNQTKISFNTFIGIKNIQLKNA